jgi:hypothetical protein
MRLFIGVSLPKPFTPLDQEPKLQKTPKRIVSWFSSCEVIKYAIEDTIAKLPGADIRIQRRRPPIPGPVSV